MENFHAETKNARRDEKTQALTQNKPSKVLYTASNANREIAAVPPRKTTPARFGFSAGS
jgi:hypothetical protein